MPWAPHSLDSQTGKMISANKTIVAAAIDHFRVAPKLCAGVAINHAEDLHDASYTCDSVRAAEPIRQAASYEYNFKHNRMVSHLAASHLAAPTPLRRAQGRVVRAGGTSTATRPTGEALS